LPWESGKGPAKTAEAKPTPQNMGKPAPAPAKTQAPVPSFEKPAESPKDGAKKAQQSSAEKSKKAGRPDLAWSDRMARANEESLVLKQELENEEMRKKIDELRPTRKDVRGSVQGPAPMPSEPDPVVRAIESSRGKMTATVEFGSVQRVVADGTQVGKWRVESIRLVGVTMTDGKTLRSFPVKWPVFVANAAPNPQQFLTPPSQLPLPVPPPPRVSGGTPSPQSLATAASGVPSGR